MADATTHEVIGFASGGFTNHPPTSKLVYLSLLTHPMKAPSTARDYFRQERGWPMRRSWILRVILAILLALGLMRGTIRADDPRPMPNGPATAPIMEQPAPVQGPVFSSGDAILPEGPGAADDPGGPHSLRERIGAHIRKCLAANVPLFCWAHHNGLGCGNIDSECKFIFGSCRTFYGEPCFRGPPPPPVPPGYPYGVGAPGGPGGRGDCRCP